MLPVDARLLTTRLIALLTCGIAGAGEADRVVEDGVLVSQENPAFAMRVDEPFSYVGRHPVTIGDMAAGERFVYVDAGNGVVRRLIIVQIEAFLPGVDEIYRYKLDGRPVVAGYPWRSNGFAFDLFESARENPTMESAATRSFLEGLGYEPPQQWMMWRPLTVADEERKTEAIIFYVEDVASAGMTLDDLYHDDSATQAWIDLQKRLEERANRSFQLTTLDGSGAPDSAAWASIPNTFLRQAP